MNRRKRVLAPLLVVAALVAAACAGGSSAETEPLEVRDVLLDGERLEYVVLDRVGDPVGEGVLTTSSESDGWLFRQQFDEVSRGDASGEPDDSSTVATDGALLPRWSERVIARANGSESYRIDYDHQAEEAVSTVVRGGDEERRDVRLRTPIYDNEGALWLWRTLPLEAEFEARYLSMNPLDRSQQTVSVSVTDRVEIEVAAGTFDTWRLQVRSGRATGVAWIEVAAPYRVVQWDNGATTMQLTTDGASASR